MVPITSSPTRTSSLPPPPSQTTEGRHAAFLNLITGNSPATGDFDIPLGIQPIISLAAPLIKSCPFDLPAKPFPALSVAAQDNVVALNGNVVVLFEMNGIASPYRATDLDTTRVGQENRRPSEVGLGQYSNLMCNFVFGLQQERTEVVAVSVRVNGQEVMVPSCNVPNVLQNFSQVVLFITNADTDVSLDNPNNVVAGPAIFRL
ncbi:hypothetical protein BC829DRAFT_478718 [Chytridium lagenaria]|nr:hypothetical protein BC829DRAFT_478718 [Chytridium lagenaria]